MGFDNECILNIQSLPGEYFCPVCRTLIYPNEALQSQCTHLYCKPCLAYIVATTHACPYDGYLVTEADSKPLIESNKALAETVGKVAVYCLYHRSGCQWQGTLAECITHCTSCTFGNSPVVCNRCGTQIIHRQVQEHTQICPGLQPQAQQVDSGQAQASATSNQAVSQDPAWASSAAAASTNPTATATTTSTATVATAASATTPTAPAAASDAPATTLATSTAVTTPAAASQGQSQVNATAYAQVAAQAQTPQQWYQQQQLQYQQYYQMYPGYDPYQQHYQQYAQYQQQAYPQYAQPQMQATSQAIQGQPQPSSYVQPQPQQLQAQVQPPSQPQPQAQAAQLPQQQQPLVQTQPQPLPQPQPQPQPQSQPQPQPQPNAQLVQMQVQQPHTPGQQPYTQAHPQTTQLPQAQIAGQQFGQPPQPHYPQPQPHPQVQPQQQLQAPPYQQTPQPQQHPQSLPQQQPHPHVQPQARPTTLQQPPMQVQPHPQYPTAHPQTQAQPMTQPQHPSTHAVTGHQSYQQPQMQQTQPGAPPQRPMLMHPQQQGVPQQHPVQLPHQFAPQQPPRMPPPSGHMSMQVQQQSMLPPQRPPASHPQQQPHLPVHQHGQQLHQYPGMHAQAPPQNLPPQQSHGHLHPGQQFPQGMVPSQQQLHPQGPPHMQQHVPALLHPQQNMPPAQALATHQALAVASRPMMANNQPIQQFPGAPGKPVQPGLNQQSPSQSHLAHPGTNLALAFESQKPQPGSQGIPVPVSTAPHSGVVDKVGHAPELSAEITANNAEGSGKIEKSATADVKITKSELEADNEKAGGEFKEKDMQPDVETVLIHGRSLDSRSEGENMELTESKHAIKEELADVPEDGTERSHVPKDGHAGENQNVEGKSDEKSGALTEVQGANLSSDANMQVHCTSAAEPMESFGLREGQMAGEVASKTQPPQQLTAPSSDRGQLRQPTHQHAVPSYEGTSFPPGYHDRNSSQLAWQGPGSGTPQVVPSSGSLTGKEVYPPHHIPYGHPSNVPVTTPRFPAPDRILPHHMSHPGAIQDRRPQEAPPYQMQAPGQNMASGQMRPLGHGFPEPIPRQGQPSVVQEPLRPPSGQPYGGGHHSDALHGGFPGPGLPTSGRVPGHVGFTQQGFPEQGIAPQGHGQSHLSLPHAGARVTHGEALTRPPQLVPHSGAFNTSSQVMPRGPPFHPEDRVGPSHLGPANALEAETYDIRRPGFSDVRQPDPLAQSNMIKANGIPGKVQVDGMRDPAFAHGLAEDRFKPLPDERFRPLPDDGMPRPFPLDPGRHNVGRREFEEDLKQFPRPAHLDTEGMRRYDGYSSSSRPHDRGRQQVGPDALPRPYDRALPGPDGIPSAFSATQVGPFQAGNAGPFPGSRPGSEHRMVDILETRRPAGLREEFGAIPDLHKPMPEFGRHNMDALPPMRSPVRDFSGLPSSRYGAGGKPHLEDIGPRELHGFAERSKAFNLPLDSSGSSFHDSKISLPPALGSGSLPGRSLRGIPDGPRGFRMMEQLDSGNFPGSIRKDLDGRDIPHIHGHPGEPFGRGRIPTGDPGFGGSYGRDFPNEAGPFNMLNVRGEMEVFELLKKRKPGTMGWCRICSVDCETVEGLDLHAQTREHQKMAMDMVLAIKRENSKKQRISEGIIHLDDSNKPRKDFGKPLK